VSHPNGGRACWARARSLPSAGPVALGKEQWLPSAILCRRLALSEVKACRVPRVCRVPFGWHSAKIVFAECPWSGTRQRPRHSAVIGFPVVFSDDDGMVGMTTTGKSSLEHWQVQIPILQIFRSTAFIGFIN